MPRGRGVRARQSDGARRRPEAAFFGITVEAHRAPGTRNAQVTGLPPVSRRLDVRTGPAIIPAPGTRRSDDPPPPGAMQEDGRRKAADVFDRRIDQALLLFIVICVVLIIILAVAVSQMA